MEKKSVENNKATFLTIYILNFYSFDEWMLLHTQLCENIFTLIRVSYVKY